MITAPVILFVYNRPSHTKAVLRSLLQNPPAAESDLFVYSDAPADDGARPTVEEVRRIVRGISGFRSVTVTERESNYGLARNVIEGVTDVVNRFGRVIVLEDDLVVAPHFLDFMNDALEIYKDDPQVGHIHGCEFTRNPALPPTFLIKWTGSWGWATWQRAWQHFNPDGKALLSELEQRGLTRRFDFNGKYGYTRMLRRQTEGRNHSWAIRWNASLFLKDMLSLNAGRSLVVNTGFDGSGTNCGNGEIYTTSLYPERLTVEHLPLTENEAARQAMSDYYARTNSFRSKAVRRIKKEISRIWKIN